MIDELRLQKPSGELRNLFEKSDNLDTIFVTLRPRENRICLALATKCLDHNELIFCLPGGLLSNSIRVFLNLVSKSWNTEIQIKKKIMANDAYISGVSGIHKMV